MAAVVVLFAFFAPLVPSEFPASQLHGLTFGGLRDVTGSIAYFFFGYGGVVMPNHSYVVVTQTDMAQYRLTIR
jgi:hypothetical protein